MSSVSKARKTTSASSARAGNREACMRGVLLIIASLVAGTAAAQRTNGTIRATVTDPQGGTFPVAFVQATREPSSSSGPTISGQRGTDGTYTIEVPPGTYELSVNVPAMKSFRRGGLVVTAGQTLQVEARLEDTVSIRTLGEDPTAVVATYFNRPDPPKGTTPRLTNGKPDLTGVWLGGPTDLGGLDLQPWAAALLRERTDNNLKDWPPSYCQPAAAVPFFTGGFFKLVHHPSTLVFMVENATGYTQMLLDGRPHPPGVGPNWLGHSVGTWDGDTLIVDAIGFRDRGLAQFRRPAAQRPASRHRAHAAPRSRSSRDRDHARRSACVSEKVDGHDVRHAGTGRRAAGVRLQREQQGRRAHGGQVKTRQDGQDGRKGRTGGNGKVDTNDARSGSPHYC